MNANELIERLSKLSDGDRKLPVKFICFPAYSDPVIELIHDVEVEYGEMGYVALT